jgi:hypothetical protein
MRDAPQDEAEARRDVSPHGEEVRSTVSNHEAEVGVAADLSRRIACAMLLKMRPEQGAM